MKTRIYLYGQGGDGVLFSAKFIMHILNLLGFDFYSRSRYENQIIGALNKVIIECENEIAGYNKIHLFLKEPEDLQIDISKFSSDLLIILTDHNNFTPNSYLIKTNHELVKNTQIISFFANLLAVKQDQLEYVFQQYSSVKVNLDKNLSTIKKVYLEHKELFASLELSEGVTNKNRVVVSGNELLAKILNQLQIHLYSYYPITPATSIVKYLADDITKYQAEDEIAAAMSVLGAASTNKYACIASSGPGISLMTECLSFAGMAEIPFLLIDIMRYSPSTGGPTLFDQSDLSHAIHAGHGFFPRLVISLNNHQDIINIIPKAFKYAYEYHIPVIVLMDIELADACYPVCESLISEVKALLVSDLDNLISINSYEHNEDGDTISSPEDLEKANEIRNAKQSSLINLVAKEQELDFKSAKNCVISFGSVSRVVNQVLDQYKNFEFYHFSPNFLSPLPEKQIVDLYKKYDNLIFIEANPNAQLRQKIERIIPNNKSHSLNQHNGENFKQETIKKYLANFAD